MPETFRPPLYSLLVQTKDCLVGLINVIAKCSGNTTG